MFVLWYRFEAGGLPILHNQAKRALCFALVDDFPSTCCGDDDALSFKPEVEGCRFRDPRTSNFNDQILVTILCRGIKEVKAHPILPVVVLEVLPEGNFLLLCSEDSPCRLAFFILHVEVCFDFALVLFKVKPCDAEIECKLLANSWYDFALGLS